MHQTYTKVHSRDSISCISDCSCKLSRLAPTKTRARKLLSNALSGAECAQRQLCVPAKRTGPFVQNVHGRVFSPKVNCFELRQLGDMCKENRH